MSAALKADFLSVPEYFDAEEKSLLRHEYIDGVVFAMAGATDDHNAISLNLASALKERLRGGPCRTYMSDVKLHVAFEGDERFYYPDVMVTCDSRDTNRLYKEFPKLIVEVLSESTERIDRFEKFLYYKRLATLEEYAHVAQEKAEVTIYRRSSGWKREVLNSVEADLRLDCVSVSIALAEIYEGVKL